MKTEVFKEMLQERKKQITKAYMQIEDTEILTLINKLGARLKEQLSPELFGLFSKYVDAALEKHADDNDFYFSQGLKFGLQIGIEIMA